MRESKDKGQKDSEFSEEFMVEMGMHQGSVLSPFHFALV